MKQIFYFLLLIVIVSSCRAINGPVVCSLPSTLISPENNKFTYYNDTSVNVIVDFLWENPTASCNSFTIQLSLDPTFSVIYYEVGSFWREGTINFENISDTTTFYWRIQSHPYEEVANEDNIFSQVYSFTFAVPDVAICYKCGVFYCTAEADVYQENVVDTTFQNQTFSIEIEEGDFSGYQYKIDLDLNVLGKSFSPTLYGTDFENRITVPNFQYNAPNVDDILMIETNGLVFDEINGIVDGTITLNGIEENYNARLEFSGTK